MIVSINHSVGPICKKKYKKNRVIEPAYNNRIGKKFKKIANLNK